jgi:hypothetical protein
VAGEPSARMAGIAWLAWGSWRTMNVVRQYAEIGLSSLRDPLVEAAPSVFVVVVSVLFLWRPEKWARLFVISCFALCGFIALMYLSFLTDEELRSSLDWHSYVPWLQVVGLSLAILLPALATWYMVRRQISLDPWTAERL